MYNDCISPTEFFIIFYHSEIVPRFQMHLWPIRCASSNHYWYPKEEQLHSAAGLLQWVWDKTFLFNILHYPFGGFLRVGEHTAQTQFNLESAFLQSDISIRWLFSYLNYQKIKYQSVWSFHFHKANSNHCRTICPVQAMTDFINVPPHVLLFQSNHWVESKYSKCGAVNYFPRRRIKNQVPLKEMVEFKHFSFPIQILKRVSLTVSSFRLGLACPLVLKGLV